MNQQIDETYSKTTSDSSVKARSYILMQNHYDKSDNNTPSS